MSYWLMKSEPSVFSFDDLLKSPGKTTRWEGVRNYQARNTMRDLIRLKDQVLFYHSSIDEPSIIGVAEVVKTAYPDKTALDPQSPYYDRKAQKKGINPWVCVDVKAKLRFKRPATREMLKSEPVLQSMVVLKKGARLSVQPVTKAQFVKINELGG